MIAFVAQSVNHMIHGLRTVPSTSTSTGACMWWVPHIWVTPAPRAGQEHIVLPCRPLTFREPGPLAGVRSLWITRCKVGKDGGGAAGKDCWAARAVSSRWTAAALPFRKPAGDGSPG